jgi:hypothetical protein
MSSPSPPPWFFELKNQQVCTETRIPIAKVLKWGMPTALIANGRLIAASPHLLVALKNLLNACCPPGSEDGRDMKEIIDAHAAIAEAEGKLEVEP